MPRLILVDGFAGTGKSTAAQRLWLDLTRAGRDARWCHEHERAHPVFQYGEIHELLRQTPGEFERGLVDAWRALATSGESGTLIIEGAFLQIPIGVMTAMGAPAARVRALLREIDGVLASVGASLVHLHHPDLPASLQQTGALRGPQWLPELIAAVGASPYGQRHKVRSFRGLTAFYARQRKVVDSIWPRLAMRHLSLDVSAGTWAQRRRRIAAFAGVRSAPDLPLSRKMLLDHSGAYRTASRVPAAITTDGQRLFAQLPATRPLTLLPVDYARGHFCAEGLPIDVRFSYGSDGRARRFTYDSRMANEVLSDTTWVRA